MRPRLFLVDLPFACYGIEVRGGRVITAPPIARWMVGQGGLAVRRYVAGKGGTITEVQEPPAQQGPTTEE